MKLKHFKEEYIEGRRDFTNEDLKFLNLSGNDYEGLILDGTNLYGTIFSRSTIVRSSFRDANISKTDFRYSVARDISFEKTRAFGTDFSYATLVNANFGFAKLKESKFTNASLTNVLFTNASMIGVDGLVLEPLRRKLIEAIERDFRCGYCAELVPSYAAGTAHRNHCPTCGYSKHVDDHVGKRDSDCKSVMKPVALSWKGKNEISLVHLCLGCSTIDKNRIAGDDNNNMLLTVYHESFTITPRIKKLIDLQGIELIQPAELHRVYEQLERKD